MSHDTYTRVNEGNYNDLTLKGKKRKSYYVDLYCIYSIITSDRSLKSSLCREARELEAAGDPEEALDSFHRAVAVMKLVYGFDQRCKTNAQIKEPFWRPRGGLEGLCPLENALKGLEIDGERLRNGRRWWASASRSWKRRSCGSRAHRPSPSTTSRPLDRSHVTYTPGEASEAARLRLYGLERVEKQLVSRHTRVVSRLRGALLRALEPWVVARAAAPHAMPGESLK